MTDAKDLMQRYCDGEAGAFRELYALVAPRLLGYLLKMARERALADDLLQQTFLKVQRAVVRIGGDDALPEIAAGLTGESDDRRDEGHGDPELVSATLDALAALPAQQREAVVLTKLDGKSVAEAAEIAGTTVGAMKVRAHRGYEALRRTLGKAFADKPRPGASKPADKTSGGAS
jgi:RNA polymerase sigma-70 factor (ECF subfamily)